MVCACTSEHEKNLLEQVIFFIAHYVQIIKKIIVQQGVSILFFFLFGGIFQLK